MVKTTRGGNVKAWIAVWTADAASDAERAPHPTFGRNDPQRLAARSRTRFIHPDSVSPAFAAARSYRSLRSGESRKPSQADSPLSSFGLPRGRFMGGLCINK
jgi:hypothetical protein